MSYTVKVRDNANEQDATYTLCQTPDGTWYAEGDPIPSDHFSVAERGVIAFQNQQREREDASGNVSIEIVSISENSDAPKTSKPSASARTAASKTEAVKTEAAKVDAKKADA